MEVEQRYVISFFHRRKMNAEQISKTLKETYKGDAYKIDAVKYWIRQLICGRTNLHDSPEREKPKDETITASVQYQIEKNPLLSARDIAKILGISPTTVVDRLTNELGYKNFHTKWVPHLLNNSQKKQRVDMAKEMLIILENDQRQNFVNIITGDESWFMYVYTQNSQWVISKDDLIEKVAKTNMQKKLMVTIFFNGKGIIDVDYLEKGVKFNSLYFINIIERIKNTIYPGGRGYKHPRKVLHYDNSPCHKSKKVKDYLENSDFRSMKHPTYSPDLAPSDFGLFGTMKDKLNGVSCQTEDELKSKIIEILEDFPESFWKSLFEEWIIRLRKVISSKGDYI